MNIVFERKHIEGLAGGIAALDTLAEHLSKHPKACEKLPMLRADAAALREIMFLIAHAPNTVRVPL